MEEVVNKVSGGILTFSVIIGDQWKESMRVSVEGVTEPTLKTRHRLFHEFFHERAASSFL